MHEQPIPRGLCQCGCGRKTGPANRTDEQLGWIKDEPLRFLRGHGNRRPGPDYVVDEATGCWVWVRAISRDTGYGVWAMDTERTYAHRLYYERHVGPIPEGMVIDHLCRRRSCVNPSHLEVVTPGENVLRGESYAARNKRKTHCPKGHLLSGANLYECRGKRQCRICRAKHLEAYRVSGKRQRDRPLTDAQARALRVAVRNGKWWLSGKGAPQTARGLESRGLAAMHSELIAGRFRRYVVPTDAGRTLIAKDTVNG